MDIFDIKEIDAFAEARVHNDNADIVTMDVVGALIEALEDLLAESDTEGLLIDWVGGQSGDDSTFSL